MRNQTKRNLAFRQTVETLTKLSTAMTKFHQKTKIKLINNLQLQIAQTYKKIMKDVSQYCEHVMGPLPCKFAVVGMGSLARNEITPYSDFEHIILLENCICDNNFVEYFRWFSVIFHVIVLNLQETIIPSLNIEYLNDKTSELGDWFFDTCTSGISFDGMMVHACKFPLGRTQPTKNKPWTTELIKPVDKMLEYLSDDVSLKNGYHLSDILTETCFVYGDQTLHDAFESGIESYKTSKARIELLDELKKQVKVDLNNFATRTKLVNLKPNGIINVKQMFYRTSTLFITALGKICETKSSSCFEIINELAEQRKISENTKHKLSYAVAIACEIRLSVYMREQSQRDYIQPSENSETIFDKILIDINKESIVSYFQITYCLQREIIKILGIVGSHIYSNPTLMNITICYALRLDAVMLSLMEKQILHISSCSVEAISKEEISDEKDKVFSFFNKCLADMENEFQKSASKMSSNTVDIVYILKILTALGSDDSFQNLEEQTEFIIRVVEIAQRLSFSNEGRMKVLVTYLTSCIGIINLIIAVNLMAMNKFDRALARMNQALKNFDETNNKPERVAWFYYMAGSNWIALKEYEKSLACWQVALGICLSIDLNQFKIMMKFDLSRMYSGIGICLLKLGHCEESLIYLKIAVQMMDELYDLKKHTSSLLFVDRASTFRNLAKCLMQLGHFEQAVSYYFQALEETESQDANDDQDVNLTQSTKIGFLQKQRVKNRAKIFRDLGMLQLKKSNDKEAAVYFKKYFKISEKLFEAKDDKKQVKLIQCYMNSYSKNDLNII